MELDSIKKRLKEYRKEQIEYNEPHVAMRCLQRETSKETIEQNLLNPENLVLAYPSKALKEGEEKYELYFKLSSNKTLKLPVVFKKNSLYIITVIMRWRKWQSMVKKRF